MRKALHILIGLTCLVPSVLIIFATQPFGMGISFDSVTYILAAESIARGQGAPTTYIEWPPFYPFLIALVHNLLQIDPIDSTLLISAVSTLITSAFTVLLIKSITANLLMAALGAAAVATFLPIFEVAVWAWSEMPFIALSACLFVVIDAYVRQPRLSRLIIASLLTALLCLTRYSGIAVVGITGLFLLIFHWRRHDWLGLIISRLAIYSVIALLPLALWAVRNLALSGTLFGMRPPALETVGISLMRIAIVFTKWTITPLFIAFIVLIPLLAAVILLIRTYQSALWQRMNQYPVTLFYIILFAFLYTLFMFISSITTAFDALSERLLSPVAVPILMLALSVGRTLFALSRADHNRLAYVLPVFVSIWIASNGISIYFIANQTRMEGKGYLSKDWRENVLINSLKKSDILKDCTLFSNNGYIVYLHLGSFAHSTPARRLYNSPILAQELNDSWLLGEESCVIWFNNIQYKFLYTLEELKTTADFTPLIELESGGVYKVRKRATP